MSKDKQMELFKFSKNCAHCDLDLEDWGRNLVTMPVSKRKVELCDSCARHVANGENGEIRAADGKIYSYIYLPHSKVVSFSYGGNSVGMYDFKLKSGAWVTGTPKHDCLEELIQKYMDEKSNGDVDAWVHKVNTLAAEIEEYMHSIHRSCWNDDEHLKELSARFTKLAASGA
jgi:hypothetical protein